MKKHAVHDFGVVNQEGDYYELLWETGRTAQCILTEIVQTERGPKRNELAVIPAALWRKVADRVVRELNEGLDESERIRKKYTLKRGINRLTILLGRELTVLFWALMETDGAKYSEAILQGWRELAREERWWLYAKAATAGQLRGRGWRLALFHALAEIPDSRSAETENTKKKRHHKGRR